jgi:hypothetical protein
MTYIDQTAENDYFLVQRSTDALQKMIFLINKRMITASKRKYYDIDG